MICTFFGHRNCPEEIGLSLESTIIDLIENKDVDMYYVGNQGQFDYMVRKTLKHFKKIYPEVEYAVVLAYMPCEKERLVYDDYMETIYPEGLESTPKKFAIHKRNMWMINEADYVVTYVRYISGGAGQFKEIAEKKGKIVINL